MHTKHFFKHFQHHFLFLDSEVIYKTYFSKNFFMLLKELNQTNFTIEILNNGINKEVLASIIKEYNSLKFNFDLIDNDTFLSFFNYEIHDNTLLLFCLDFIVYDNSSKWVIFSTFRQDYALLSVDQSIKDIAFSIFDPYSEISLEKKIELIKEYADVDFEDIIQMIYEC